MEVKISIIIPFYNGSKYLEDCVSTVTNQTMRETEIILVDDGSTDNSAEIAVSLSEKDSRIKFIRQENKGVSTARNNAINSATGEYLMFVDADDRLKKDSCEILYKAITETDSDIATGTYVSFDDTGIVDSDETDGETLVTYSPEDIKELSLNMGENNFFRYAWRRLFSAKLIKEKGITFHPDIAIGEDTLFCLESFLTAKKSVFVSSQVYEYRRNTQGVMRSQKYNKNTTRSILLQYEEKKRLCEKFMPEHKEAFLAGCAHYAYKYACRIVFDNIFHKGNASFKEYRQVARSSMIRDMFRYFDIDKYRSKSLDFVALKLLSYRLVVMCYFVERLMYKIK